MNTVLQQNRSGDLSMRLQGHAIYAYQSLIGRGWSFAMG
jgi:hypothetical protein